MSERTLFEYAVIRYVPRVEREEFLNVGVILFCQKQKFLDAKIYLDKQRILSFFPSADLDELSNYLHAFVSISSGSRSGGPIASLDQASRFRWLTAARSTIVQTSRVHPGLCETASETLLSLFNEQVIS